MRALLVVWFVTLGSILCSHGYGWGALLYLAAAKELGLGYRLLKTNRARALAPADAGCHKPERAGSHA